MFTHQLEAAAWSWSVEIVRQYPEFELIDIRSGACGRGLGLRKLGSKLLNASFPFDQSEPPLFGPDNAYGTYIDVSWTGAHQGSWGRTLKVFLDKLGLQPEKCAETSRRILAYRLISKFLTLQAFGGDEWQVNGHTAYAITSMESPLQVVTHGAVGGGLLGFGDQLKEGKYWVLTKNGLPSIAVSHDAVLVDLSSRSRIDAMEVFRRNGRRLFPLLDHTKGRHL